MTKEEIAVLNKRVAGYKRDSRVFLASKNLQTRRSCTRYLQDVALTLHHMLMADVFPQTNWERGEYRDDAIRYAKEHLQEWRTK